LKLVPRRFTHQYQVTTRIERARLIRRTFLLRISVVGMVLAAFALGYYSLYVALAALVVALIGFNVFFNHSERWLDSIVTATSVPDEPNETSPPVDLPNIQDHKPEPVEVEMDLQDMPRQDVLVVQPILAETMAVQSQVAEGALKTSRETFFSRLFTHSVLGIDMGNAHIKIAEVAQGNKPRLLRYSIVPTPRGSVENGVIRRPEDLSAAINEALLSGKFSTRRAATTLTGQNLMLRELRLPPMPKKELRAAIDWQIERLMQLNRADTVTDFSLMPAISGEETRVMVVAMHKEPIVKFVDYMKDKGFNIERVDIEPLSVFRAAMLATRGQVAQGGHLVCDFGAGTTNISIFQDGQLQTARVIPIGGHQFTRAIMVDHDLDFAQAESAKIAHGCEQDSPYLGSLLPIRDLLFGEISTTVNFYLSEHRSLAIDSVLAVGGNSVLLGSQLETYLRNALRSVGQGFTATILNPLEHMSHDVAPTKAAWCGATLCVAIGLALGEV